MKVVQHIKSKMEKNPKEMTCEELYIKLKEDSVNVNVASTVRGELINDQLSTYSPVYNKPILILYNQVTVPFNTGFTIQNC